MAVRGRPADRQGQRNPAKYSVRFGEPSITCPLQATACKVSDVDELARALDIVGRKWTLLIVDDLMHGPRRFTEIERSLGDANPKMVIARLRELQAAGLVSRTMYAEVPPKVEYALTDRGRELRSAINALRRWGTQTPKRSAPPRRVQR